MEGEDKTEGKEKGGNKEEEKRGKPAKPRRKKHHSKENNSQRRKTMRGIWAKETQKEVTSSVERGAE